MQISLLIKSNGQRYDTGTALDTFHWPQLLSFSGMKTSTLNINAETTKNLGVKVVLANLSSDFSKTGYDIDILVNCGASSNQ